MKNKCEVYMIESVDRAKTFPTSIANQARSLQMEPANFLLELILLDASMYKYHTY